MSQADDRLLAVLEDLSTMLHLSRDNDSYLSENQSKITNTVRWLTENCDVVQLTNFIRTANLCEEEVILDLLAEPYFRTQ